MTARPFQTARTWRPTRASVIGLGLIAPLALLVLAFLVLPLFRFAYLSVDNRAIAQVLSLTSQAMRDHPVEGVPDDAVFAAFQRDLARDPEGVAKLAARLNFFEGGLNSLVRKTSAQMATIPPNRAGFTAFDKRWGEGKTWRAIGVATHPVIPEYYLNALDLRTDEPSRLLSIEPKPEGQRIYLRLWARTIMVALFVVSVCTLVGYPIAHFLSRSKGMVFTLAMGLVLLPFWTPLLARIASWKVLLESNGVINSLLVASGLVSEAGRPQLLNNLFATVLVMSYVLLPYAILPTYAVMKRVQPSLFSAALTLGATPVRAFFTVYLPQTLPGVLAGGILIFVLSFGFYLTPELVGGPSGSLIGNMIAYNFSRSLNWGLAGALSTMLLIVIAAAALLLRAVSPKPSARR